MFCDPPYECTKIRYISEVIAIQYAEQMEKKYGKQTPYLCELCNVWHLTSN